MNNAELDRAKFLVQYQTKQAIDPILEFLDWLKDNQADRQGEPTFFSFLKNPTFWINFAKVAWRLVKILIARGIR
jgi:hypothetical protein